MVLDIVGIAAMCEAEGGNQGELHGFLGLALADENGLAVAQLLVFLFVNGIQVVAVFHLAKIDDLVVPVDEQVDLNASLVGILAFGLESP